MTDDLELRHLRYFVAVAGERHFGRAAAALRVTQPVVSRQIRSLERILGVPLLATTRPAVRLTAAGESFLKEARETLQCLDRATRIAQQIISGKETISIAFEPCSSFHNFASITRKLHAAMPHIRFAIREAPVAEHAQGLRTGEIDIAYGHKAEPSEGIRFEALKSEPLMIGLPTNHRLAGRRAIALAELKDQPLVFWPRLIAPLCHDYILSIIGRAMSPDIRHTVPDHGKLLDAVAAGMGWTLAPACTRGARHSGVAFRPIRGIKTAVELGISHLASPRDAAVRTLILLWKEDFARMAG
ncbi:MAG TPA: LysR family transcriptional regulator [Bryobacteraceae bacterium]|nr:LysR family transcriptional regulator [Bryobacteraceae bacterium]